MKILVLGREGQLARAMAAEAAGRPDVSVILAGRPETDIANAASLGPLFASVAPDAVVNTAAYTAVDDAETEPELARAVNGDGAGNVARACARFRVPLVHVSTDYVFDGALDRAYREDDATGPIGSYGRSKLEGEHQVARELDRHVILRTAWVHSPWGRNFAKTMLKLGETRDTVSVVSDQLGCPTYAPHLGKICLDIARRIAGEERSSALWGTYHCAGSGDTNWWAFAQELFRLRQARGAPAMTVKAITTAEFPTRTRRPANSRLDCTKLANGFGLTLPPWQVGARDCVDAIMSAT